MRILVVVAHPDDEVLGCGGMIAKHVEAGDAVNMLMFSSRPETRDAAYDAADVLGHQGLDISDQVDQRFDDSLFVGLVDWVSQELVIQVPDIVYTHNPDDLNLDHSLTARAVLTALRPSAWRGTILAFETISSTEFGVTPFQPNWYEPLTDEHIQKKIAALWCYPTEVREQPHPRNTEGILNRAALRGDEICVDYAEAFRLLRKC